MENSINVVVMKILSYRQNNLTIIGLCVMLEQSTYCTNLIISHLNFKSSDFRIFFSEWMKKITVFMKVKMSKTYNFSPFKKYLLSRLFLSYLCECM